MKQMMDRVKIDDSLQLNTGGKSVELCERSVVETKNWVKVVLRERGKIVATREGKNVWTNSGREYLAQLMSPQDGGTPYRSDVVAYFGVGTGLQLEVPGVTTLLTPIAYSSGLFLADIQTVSFPLYPIRTTVSYKRIFIENEITLVPGTVMISEFGLYTNGDPASTPNPYAFGSRDRTYAVSKNAAPVAYKTFEPVGKTDTMQLEVIWEIRF